MTFVCPLKMFVILVFSRVCEILRQQAKSCTRALISRVCGILSKNKHGGREVAKQIQRLKFNIGLTTTGRALWNGRRKENKRRCLILSDFFNAVWFRVFIKSRQTSLSLFANF